MGFSRREFLALTGISAAALALSIDAPVAHADPIPLADDPFTLGVASGAPRPDGLVLWTRLAPRPLPEDGHGGMPQRPVLVRWQVSRDPSFRRIDARGQALAQPELAHTVHPRVSGLKPSTAYHYRFQVGSRTSPVGRFTTLPAPGARVDSFSVASVSCQAWYHVHFTAHRHLAAGATSTWSSSWATTSTSTASPPPTCGVREPPWTPPRRSRPRSDG